MKKRILSLILIISMIMGLCNFAIATEVPDSISLEQEMYLDENGILMIPLRSTLEDLDYEVKWSDHDKNVEILKGDKNVIIKIGSNNVGVNGEIKKLKSSPIIKNNKTFIPAELLSRYLDIIVGWNMKHNNLEIREESENKEEFFTSSEDEKIKKELNKYMKSLEEHENFHGSILVAKEDKVLLNEGYGYANFTQNTINKPETRFAIGSVTKQFAAVGILKLSEEGLLNVEDTVSKYIPNLSHGEEITIHNLLTHTSGLKEYTQIPGFLEYDIENKDPMKMLELIKDMELEFKPGEMYRYSNTNYLALGMIIEKVSGQTFEAYLKDIVSPLGMKDTGIIYGKYKGSNDATPYVGYLEVQEIDDDAVLSQAFAAGSMYSTVEDLYRWDRAIKSGKILKQKTLKEIFKNHIPISETESYGYGWMIDNTKNRKEICHGGNTQGFTAYTGRLEEQDITVIILTNSGYYNTYDLKKDLLSITLNEEYEMPKELKEIKIEDKNLYSKYTGKYEFINGLDLNIIEDKEKLYVQVPGMENFEIYPKTTTEFFGKAIDVDIMFKTDDQGKAIELIFNQIGMDIVCKRIGDVEEKKEVEIDPKIYDEYVGEYDLQIGATITIIREGDKLYARVTGQETFEILPSSETEFFYKTIDANMTFIKDKSGKVIKLVFRQSGQVLESPRIK